MTCMLPQCTAVVNSKRIWLLDCRKWTGNSSGGFNVSPVTFFVKDTKGIHLSIFIEDGSIKRTSGQEHLSGRGCCGKMFLRKLAGAIGRYSSALSFILFFVGAGTGVYQRWLHHTSDSGLLALCVLLSVAVLISLASHLYGWRDFARGFAHFWMGLCFSILSFTEIAYDHMFVSLNDLDATDILILTSVGLHCFKTAVDRLCSTQTQEPTFLTTDEFLLISGFLAGSVATVHFLDIAALMVAVSLHLVAFHLKSSLTLLSGISLCILVDKSFFPAIGVSYNPFCLFSFACRFSFAAVIDIYFSRLSFLELLRDFIMQGRCTHRLQILGMMAGECAFLAFSIQVSGSSNIAVFRIPLLILGAVLFVTVHIAFLVTCWGFTSKLEECAASLTSKGDITDDNMSEVMASKGIRHFCLVSQIVTLYTLISTVLLGGAGWQHDDPMLLSLLFIVLPMEFLTYDVLAKLGKSIGGTAAGYALVSPAHHYSPTGDVLVLAENNFQLVNAKAMELVNIVSRFFASHMIHNFGTDFSTSGISLEHLETKVRSFFEQRADAGLHYDTYVLYYSGHVLADGNWALTEGKSLSFDMILKWWREVNAGTGARLILFLDTVSSSEWLKTIWQIEGDFIAIQTGSITITHDPESGDAFPLGELTKLWEDFHSDDPKPENQWKERGSNVKPIYGVSKNWCSFKFHEPTVEDIAQHVEQHFPRLIKPITRLFTHLPCNTNLLCVCDCFAQVCRRLKMRWCPPAVYDTGHGFNLIR